MKYKQEATRRKMERGEVGGVCCLLPFRAPSSLLALSPSCCGSASESCTPFGSAISGLLSGIREMWYREDQPEECMTPSQPRRAGELYWTPALVGSLAFCLVPVSPGACAVFTGLAFCYKLWGPPLPPSWHHVINPRRLVLPCLTPQIRSPPMWTHL